MLHQNYRTIMSSCRDIMRAVNAIAAKPSEEIRRHMPELKEQVKELQKLVADVYCDECSYHVK